ncbi:hypothetical protein JCM19037_4174 [Geomicrobium sp. JCM 19037]|nr:hypothetical protein JCM19037_4174 [Geomicrobium sp. JCM 19037]
MEDGKAYIRSDAAISKVVAAFLLVSGAWLAPSGVLFITMTEDEISGIRPYEYIQRYFDMDLLGILFLLVSLLQIWLGLGQLIKFLEHKSTIWALYVLAGLAGVLLLCLHTAIVILTAESLITVVRQMVFLGINMLCITGPGVFMWIKQIRAAAQTP